MKEDKKDPQFKIGRTGRWPIESVQFQKER